MAEKIIFNGKQYNHVGEMPPEVRQMYEILQRLLKDENMDGVPDIAQGGGLGGLREGVRVLAEITKASKNGLVLNQDSLNIIHISDNSISVNGKTYRNAEEMPAEIRQKYQKAMSAAEPGQGEIYDETWRERGRDSYFKPHDDEVIEPAYTVSTDRVIEPVGTNPSWIILVVAVAVVVCAGLGFYFWLASQGF